jgi:hypothetical protein
MELTDNLMGNREEPPLDLTGLRNAEIMKSEETRLDLSGLLMSAEGANLARRNQMKLSGKRTLPQPNSGKFVLPGGTIPTV